MKASSMIIASLLWAAGGRDAAATRLAQDCSGAGFLASAVVVSGSALYDIATAPSSARRYNQRHLSIAPLVDPRHGSFGVSASWSFGRASRPSGGHVAAPPRKSPTAAFVLSLASTAGPMLAGAAMGNDAGAELVLGGLIIGPSIGHLYAGQVGRGLGTIGLRGLGTVVGLYSIVGCFND
jgi:hypothetical protein